MTRARNILESIDRLTSYQKRFMNTLVSEYIRRVKARGKSSGVLVEHVIDLVGRRPRLSKYDLLNKFLRLGLIEDYNLNFQTRKVDVGYDFGRNWQTKSFPDDDRTVIKPTKKAISGDY